PLPLALLRATSWSTNRQGSWNPPEQVNSGSSSVSVLFRSVILSPPRRTKDLLFVGGATTFDPPAQ
ncbi:MAG: hypothetical protein WAM71_07770, partial [Candidatus Korobacteraceae bacterium]